MRLIIDADTIVYKAAGATQFRDKVSKRIEYAPVVHAFSNAKQLMYKILLRCQSDKYELYLTQCNDTTCFRTALYKDYKANRKQMLRPKYYEAVRNYLVKHWDARIVSKVEADDAVCKRQYELWPSFPVIADIDDFDAPACLVGIDKDLDQIPGLHYNYDKDNFYYISVFEGLKNLYKQVLAGDRADNIPRIKKGWRSEKVFSELDQLSPNNPDLIIDCVKKEMCRVLEREDIEEELQFRLKLLTLLKD